MSVVYVVSIPRKPAYDTFLDTLTKSKLYNIALHEVEFWISHPNAHFAPRMLSCHCNEKENNIHQQKDLQPA